MRIIKLIILLGTIILLIGCWSQPGNNINQENFAGQAVETPCSSDEDCRRSEICLRGVCSGDERESRATEQETSRNDRSGEERDVSEVPEGEGYGGSQCTDSDGGTNFLTKGKIEIAGEVKEDYCHKFNDGSIYLFEAICSTEDPVGYSYVQKKCEEGGAIAGLEPAGAFQCVEGKCVPKETCWEYVESEQASWNKIIFEGEEYQGKFGFSDAYSEYGYFGAYGFNIFSTKDNSVGLAAEPVFITDERKMDGKEIWISAKLKQISGKTLGTICLSTMPKNTVEKSLALCQESGFKSVCTKEKVLPCDASCTVKSLWGSTNQKNCVLACLLKGVKGPNDIPLFSDAEAEQCYANGCSYEALKDTVCDAACATYECQYDLQKCAVPSADYTTVKGEEVTLKEGGSYTLQNNMQIKVQKIIEYTSWEGEKFAEKDQFVVVEVEHAINTKNVFLFPISFALGKSESSSSGFGMATEFAGYRIAYKNYNALDNSLTVMLYPLTGKLSSAKDLFTECKKYRSFLECQPNSALEPLTDEIKVETDNFIILGQQKIEPYLKYVQDEVESCYTFDAKELGLSLKKKKFPVRVRSDHSMVNNVKVFGMYLFVPPQTAANPTYSTMINGKCDDALIAHEVVHTIYQDKHTAPKLPDVLNEGLAMHVSSKVQSTFTCLDDGVILPSGKKRPFYPLNKYDIWLLGDNKDDPPSSELYFDSGCFFQELEKDVGKEKFGLLLKNLYKPTQKTFLDMLKEQKINSTKYETKYGIDTSSVFEFKSQWGLSKGEWDAGVYSK